MRNGIGSNRGNVVVINDFRFNKILYFITLTNTYGGAPYTFSLTNVRNPTDPTPGADMQVYYWSATRKRKRIDYPTTATW